MGLSLHYEVRFGDGEAAWARELVRTLYRRAGEFARAKRIEKVLPISEDREDLDRFALRWLQQRHPDDPDTICGVAVPPLEGSLFPVVPGGGCEPARREAGRGQEDRDRGRAPAARGVSPRRARAASYPPILKLALTWKTALTMAKAMKPTKMKTAMSTPLAITLVKRFSWLEIRF